MYKAKICTFNLKDPINSQLGEKIPNLYTGSIGTRINVPNHRREDKQYCLLNYDFPSNIHEYEIFIIDLLKDKSIEYKRNDHTKKYTIGSSSMVLQSSYPETLFDPKPLCLHILSKEINSLLKKSLFIVFAESNYKIEYQPVIISDSYPKEQQKVSYSIYNFFNFPTTNRNKEGVETKVNELIDSELKKILQKYNDESTYLQTFYHPVLWDSEKKGSIEDPNFLPLMFNSQDEIISYAHFNKNLSLFVLPQIKDKGEFLNDFLFDFAPNIVPEFFPEIVKHQWTREQEYFLPNHDKLLKTREQEILRHEKGIKKIENRISSNNKQFRYLHDILIQTGDELVSSVIKFLKWLGFENVVDLDTEKKLGLEEDIQIETPKGLIILEVKGIGGTSKDSDCSQVAKIKYRRAKERGNFDVFAHYIVNHQRHIPPLSRNNPPFTDNQIQDAQNEERGLISTWQLFKLYWYIQNGITTKEEAKNKFYDSGLIDFKPSCELLGRVEELYQNGYVAILKITKAKISIGETLLIEKNQKLIMVKIMGLQVNDSNVLEAENTEVGIKFDKKIDNKSLIYKKNC